MTHMAELSKEEKLELLERIVEIPNYVGDEASTLQRYLDDPEAEVRTLAIKGLWHYPEPEFIPPLVAAAEQDPDEGVRCQAIRTLGRYIYEGAMADYEFDFGAMEELVRVDELPQEDFLQVKEFLLGIYRDEDKSIDERRYAVEAISFLFDEEVSAIIEEAYAHADPNMKLSAIFGMGRNGSNQWADMLRKEMYNPDPKIQWEAVRAVGEAQMDALGKDLWRLTYSEDPDIQEIAIWALGQSGWEGAFERLEELSMDGNDPEIQEIAEEALEEWLFYSEIWDNDEFLDDDEFDEDWGIEA